MLEQNFIINKPQVHYQSTTRELVKNVLELKQGELADNGALCIHTGKFTGRSPEDKYYVKDKLTESVIDWGGFNHPISISIFEALRKKIIAHFDKQKEIWVTDVAACADPKYKLPLRVYTELPWAAIFVNNMFIKVDSKEEISNEGGWTLFHAPNFLANPEVDGVRASNFSIISFTHKEIIIGGTGYTGEIKKGIFSVLNFILPHYKNVLSMHCSANMSEQGEVALFFGLSGTGKTTLSADPNRKLIGDDEHGWTEDGIFNFEGGCYAKTINLDANNEPSIFNAIKEGALLENVLFEKGGNKVNYNDASITENTRVSYPIQHIKNIAIPSVGRKPSYIFFLACDAYGILPPISKLSPSQAMYQFISGYTAKIAGTEVGIKAPKATFSACFGAPFFPLHPGVYARLLGEKLKKEKTEVWLINTGWSGGPYGIGKRIHLKDTRAMIQAVCSGEMAHAAFELFEVFQFQIPSDIKGVDKAILHPRNTWANKDAYDKQLKDLAIMFQNNFTQFEKGVDQEILLAAPLL